MYYDSNWVEIVNDPMNNSKFGALITMDIGV